MTKGISRTCFYSALAIFSFLISFSFFVGWKDDDDSTTDAAALKDSGTSLSFQTVDNGTAFNESFTEVVRSSSAWNALYSSYTASPAVTVTPPPPSGVDFSTEMLIYISGGEQSSGGHSVEIKTVTLYKEKIIVYYVSISPGPGEIAPQVVSYPGHVISIQLYDLDVQFNKL